MGEKVLCVRLEKIKEFFDGKVPQGCQIDFFKARSLLSCVLNDKNLFVDRQDAEKDSTIKQLIPYIVLQCQDKFFCYQRSPKGGEDRLHGLWSIGIGGHINQSDELINRNHVYSRAFVREVEEEIGIHVSLVDPFRTIRGYINDDSNEVGKVHLGIVHVLDVQHEDSLHINDPALSMGKFLTLDELLNKERKFESWSELLLENLSSWTTH